MDKHSCDHGHNESSTPIDPQSLEHSDQHHEAGGEKSQGVGKRNVENHTA
jgi:hypothetical protein